MKRRSGFVSNSSSSSFVVVWREIGEEELDSVPEPWIYLRDWGEAPALGSLDQATLAFIREHPGVLKGVRYYEVALKRASIGLCDFEAPEGDDWKIVAKYLSYHTPYGLDDLLQYAAPEWLTPWVRNISSDDLRKYGGSRMALSDIRSEIGYNFESEEMFREALENEI